MERAELALWLRLTLTPGIGNETARRLLASFGLPYTIFQQSGTALRQVISDKLAQALAHEPDGLAQQVERTWEWLQAVDSDQPADSARAILTLADSRYPPALLETADPPLVLYLLGAAHVVGPDGPNAPLALDPGIAIVGSRNPTPQGATNARQFARALAEHGLSIVSGLAVGVDGAAHEGALDSGATKAGWPVTIAVVGTGLDRVYPRRHHDLARRIASHGLLVSEYPIGTPPLAANFPRRNRIIAALSQGTLVVEAALQSGSLITARLAVEQGRDVFAIPGSIHSPQSRGCHALIRQGAKLVESAQDVLEELKIPVLQFAAEREYSGTGVPDAPQRDLADGPLLQALGFDPVGLDALQARTGLETAHLQAQLMALELAGQVARLPGGLFQRIAQG
ncbi:MAG: DNA-processing protein DprA [Burkholderiaceae bacterium]